VDVNWGELWRLVWPILRQAVIALLITLLGLLSYDKYVPSRFARTSGDGHLPDDCMWKGRPKGETARCAYVDQAVAGQGMPPDAVRGRRNGQGGKKHG